MGVRKRRPRDRGPSEGASDQYIGYVVAPGGTFDLCGIGAISTPCHLPPRHERECDDPDPIGAGAHDAPSGAQVPPRVPHGFAPLAAELALGTASMADALGSG